MKTPAANSGVFAMKNNFSNSTRMRGGQPGNRNAVGNHGGAPKGNKNRLSHGLHERITLQDLTPEESALVASIPSDMRVLMRYDLQLLCVREKRILVRIADLKSFCDFSSSLSSVRHTHTRHTEAEEETSSVERAAIIDQILRCEYQLLHITHEKMRIIAALQGLAEKEEQLQMQSKAKCEDTETITVIYS